MQNYCTGGACPDEAAVLRRLDRFYHMELRDVEGEPYAVLSISGDAFLRGQVREIGS